MAEKPNRRHLVFVVPGFGGSHLALRPLEAFLLGFYNQQATVHLATSSMHWLGTTDGVMNVARRAALELGNLIGSGGFTHLSLIGISMGGVVIRALLTLDGAVTTTGHDGGDGSADLVLLYGTVPVQFITVATPHQGLDKGWPKAVLWLMARTCRTLSDLAGETDVLQRVRNPPALSSFARRIALLNQTGDYQVPIDCARIGHCNQWDEDPSQLQSVVAFNRDPTSDHIVLATRQYEEDHKQMPIEWIRIDCTLQTSYMSHNAITYDSGVLSVLSKCLVRLGLSIEVDDGRVNE